MSNQPLDPSLETSTSPESSDAESASAESVSQDATPTPEPVAEMPASVDSENATDGGTAPVESSTEGGATASEATSSEKPADSSPAAAESSTTESATTESATTESATTESATTESATAGAAGTESTVAESVPADATAVSAEGNAVPTDGSAAPTDGSAAPDSEDKPKIAIGSQRLGEDAAVPVKPKAVADAEADPIPAAASLPDGPVDTSKDKPLVPKNVGPVPVPSKRTSSQDLDSQVAATVGDVNMESVMGEAKTGDASADDIEIGARCKGTVARIHQDNVFFTLKGRFEGVASKRSFKKEPEVGAMTDVVVKRYNEDDGIYEVAVPGTSVSVEDWSDLQVGTVVEARVTGSNTGGLECVVNSIRGFIPASQIALHRVENLGDYVNKKLSCVITEAKPKRKNLVLSHRKVLEKEMAEIRKESMAKLEVGSIVEGKVTRIREFGAFVDIGGVEGLVHISKLSWQRIEKPTEVVQEGETIKVKIEKINPENGKIALSMRDTVAHPWDGIEEKYPANTTVKGTVTRLAAFGAFVRLEPGVEGLVHISELAHHRVVAVKNIVKEGDEIEVKILNVDRGSQKMGLSLKATIPAPEKPEKKEDEVQEAPRELAVRARRKPLKGGTDRKSGGESFGLKW